MKLKPSLYESLECVCFELTVKNEWFIKVFVDSSNNLYRLSQYRGTGERLEGANRRRFRDEKSRLLDVITMGKLD